MRPRTGRVGPQHSPPCPVSPSIRKHCCCTNARRRPCHGSTPHEDDGEGVHTAAAAAERTLPRLTEHLSSGYTARVLGDVSATSPPARGHGRRVWARRRRRAAKSATPCRAEHSNSVFALFECSTVAQGGTGGGWGSMGGTAGFVGRRRCRGGGCKRWWRPREGRRGCIRGPVGGQERPVVSGGGGREAIVERGWQREHSALQLEGRRAGGREAVALGGGRHACIRMSRRRAEIFSYAPCGSPILGSPLPSCTPSFARKHQSTSS